MADDAAICSVCDRPLEGEIEAYGALDRITSDSKVLGRGGRLAQCPYCGTVQKPNDAAWQRECAEIYRNYDSYAISAGQEQAVRGGPPGNRFAPRSDLMIEAIRDRFDLPARGRLLDYGCGRGATTKATQRLLPDWRVDAYDLDRRAEAELSALPVFDRFFSGEPEAIEGQYDLIVLTHVLEHVPRGHEALRHLGSLLTPGGHILVQVPDRILNPFDLLLADHTVHFDPASLHAVAVRSGFSVELLSTEIVVKELTLLAGHGAAIAPPGSANVPAARQIEWLNEAARTCRDAAAKAEADGRPWGIFGTSNVAAWLSAEIGRRPGFYIDEDEAKIGRELNSTRIVAPPDAPGGATVVMAMAPLVASRVAERFSPLGLHFVPFPPAPA